MKELFLIEGTDPQEMVDEIKSAQYCVCNSELYLDCSEVQGIFWALHDLKRDGCFCGEPVHVLVAITPGEDTHCGWEVNGWCDYHANSEDESDMIALPRFSSNGDGNCLVCNTHE